MTWHATVPADEVGTGKVTLVEANGRSIGLIEVSGSIVAVLNRCPHEHAPICAGRVTGTTLTSSPGDFVWGREGEILACPWHGWEFDLTTGHAMAARHRLTMYPVMVEDEMIYVDV